MSGDCLSRCQLSLVCDHPGLLGFLQGVPKLRKHFLFGHLSAPNPLGMNLVRVSDTCFSVDCQNVKKF